MDTETIVDYEVSVIPRVRDHTGEVYVKQMGTLRATRVSVGYLMVEGVILVHKSCENGQLAHIIRVGRHITVSLLASCT